MSSRTAPADGFGVDTLWVRQVEAFLRRYLREFARDRAVLFWSLGFPAAFYVMTVSVILPMDQIPVALHGPIEATTAVGYGVFGSVVVCLNGFGQHLVADVDDRRYAEFRALPLRPSADLVGRVLAGLVLAFAAFAFVLVVSLPIGATYAVPTVSGLLASALALALMALMWMVVSLLIAVSVSTAQYANVVSLSLAMMAYFLTGFNGTDVTSFAGPAWLLNAVPNSLATRVMIGRLVRPSDPGALGLTAPPVPTSPGSIGLLGLYGVVCFALGLLVLRRSLYRGVRR